MKILLHKHEGKDYVTILADVPDASRGRDVTAVGRIFQQHLTDEQFREVCGALGKGTDAQGDTINRAVVYLRRFQDWRTQKDVRTLSEAGIEPKELTKAIDKVLSFFGQGKPLINCEDCAHNRGTGCLVGKCEYSPITKGAKK